MEQLMEHQYRTVTLTDRPPVRIRDDAWPIVAQATYRWHDKIRAALLVRRHSDGRALVYATYDYSTASLSSLYQNEQDVLIRVGRLLEPGDDLVRAIRTVAAELRDRLARDGQDERLADRLADEAIADLPPEALD